MRKIPVPTFQVEKKFQSGTQISLIFRKKISVIKDHKIIVFESIGFEK